MKRKILFFAMQNSIHSVRWINQLADQDKYDIHLFPVNTLPPHSALSARVTLHVPYRTISLSKILYELKRRLVKFLLRRDLPPDPDTLHNVTTKGIYPFPIHKRLEKYVYGAKFFHFGATESLIQAAFGPTNLCNLVKKLKPDLIHSLEFQLCGYNVLYAKRMYGDGFPKWLATNWGSDIYHFRKIPAHLEHIQELLHEADYYSCECERDVRLARELGFGGQAMPVFPNTGGFDIEQISRLRSIHKTSQRKIVMVKGYEHFAGRGLMALEVIERCHIELQGFTVFVFVAGPEVVSRAEELRDQLGVDIRCLPYVNHDQMLRLYGRSRVYLGISVSDAISTSVLEAIALGAFPIQTNTSCCEEWIEDGKTGFAIPADDIEIIADRFRQALVNDELVDTASEINERTLVTRLDQDLLKSKTLALYDSIFEPNSDRLHGGNNIK